MRGRAVGSLSHRHLDHLRQVQRLTPGVSLGNLLLTAEPIGNDDRAPICIANPRKNPQLSDLLRHLVVLGPESERARHAAASRLRQQLTV